MESSAQGREWASASRCPSRTSAQKRARVLAARRSAGGRGATGIRNRALLVVLWRAGLRTAEALAEHPERAEALVARLVERVRCNQVRRQRLHAQRPPVTPGELPADARRSLEALGYLEPDTPEDRP